MMRKNNQSQILNKQITQTNQDRVALKLAWVLSMIIAVISLKAMIQLIISWFKQPVIGYYSNVMIAAILSIMMIIVLLFDAFQFNHRFKEKDLFITLGVALCYFIFGFFIQKNQINIWSYLIFFLTAGSFLVVYLLGYQLWQLYQNEKNN